MFVGTEFDSIAGRGGNDGTPIRKTPWGEIAYQLGGESALALLAEHETQVRGAGRRRDSRLPAEGPASA